MRCLSVPDFSKHCASFQSNQNLSTIRASKYLDFSLLDDIHFLANFSLYARYKGEMIVTSFLTTMPQIKKYKSYRGISVNEGDKEHLYKTNLKT